MNMSSLVGVLFLALASTTAYAGALPVSEPGVFELLAIGGVAAIVISIRNRRKK